MYNTEEQSILVLILHHSKKFRRNWQRDIQRNRYAALITNSNCDKIVENVKECFKHCFTDFKKVERIYFSLTSEVDEIFTNNKQEINYTKKNYIINYIRKSFSEKEEYTFNYTSENCPDIVKEIFNNLSINAIY